MNLSLMSSLARSLTVLTKFTASLRGGITLEKDMISKILALIMAGSIAAMMMWVGSEVRTYEGWIMIGGTFLSGLYTHWLWGFVTSDELRSRHR